VKRLEDYRGIVSDEIITDLHRRASLLLDKHVVHMNSTAQGGGVAEMLYALVPLMNDVGVDAGWRVLVGDDDFFSVTKKFHNALQGDRVNLTENKKRLYLQANESFSQYNHISHHDAVIIHDPQPLPIIRFYKKRQPWIWRCHIDLTSPDPGLWEFLKGYIMRYDLMIVSHQQYLRPDLTVEQRVINPAIDPLNQKNVELPERTVMKYIKRHGIPLDKPLITQVSRFDKWKDPLGVIEVFRRVREKTDCRLVMLGNMADDDPEGPRIYAEAAAQAQKIEGVRLITKSDPLLVNALQRTATVVVQLSLREGFGLTVSEALWKETSVVATKVGGIPLQIEDGRTGFLADSRDYDTLAERVLRILNDPELGADLGRKGKERVQKNFLMPRLLLDWLKVLAQVS